MLLEIVLITLTLIVLLVASYSDIRTREVPDWLNYGFLFAALGTRFIFSIENNWQIILSGLLGFAICFALAHLFYYTKQWGGGDSKLLMGMGAVIGVSYPLNLESFSLLWFLAALLLLGAVYGIFWMSYLAIKKRNQFLLKFKEAIKNYKRTHLSIALISLTFLILSLFYSSLWYFVPFPLGTFYLFLFVNSVEKSCFLVKVKPDKLTEGDWLAESVYWRGKLLVNKKTLDRTSLDKIKKHGIKLVTIKEGIPFVPSFLFAYIVILFWDKVSLVIFPF